MLYRMKFAGLGDSDAVKQGFNQNTRRCMPSYADSPKKAPLTYGGARFTSHLAGSSLHAHVAIHSPEMKWPRAVWGDAVQTALHAHTSGAELIAFLYRSLFQSRVFI